MVTPYGSNGQACINFAFNNATLVNKVVVYLPGTTNGVGTNNQVTDYAIDAQHEDEFFIEKCDFVVYNNEDDFDVEDLVKRMINEA